MHGGRLPEGDGGASSAAALRRPQPGHLRAETGPQAHSSTDKDFYEFNRVGAQLVSVQKKKNWITCSQELC